MIRNTSKTATQVFSRVSCTGAQRTVYNGWANVETAPPDPILGLSQAFQADTFDKKVNLGVGAYRDNNGKPYILNCVRKASERIQNHNHEYAGIAGVPSLGKVAAELAFGPNSPVLKEKRNVTMQSISGTGALRVAGEFLARFQPGTPIYLPAPTWANHIPLFKDSGLEVRSYGYYDPKTCGLNFKAMVDDIKNAPNGSIILYHACAHNPTGVDPTMEQWKELAGLTKDKGHFALFDCAYQGFASGDCERDVASVRLFVDEGLNIALCQSFAKNFGLYGQRTGAVTFMGNTEGEAVALRSQMSSLIRPMYSNPPIYGALIVSTVLEDPELRKEWYEEVKLMSGRIIEMRQCLVDGLQRAGSTRSWQHIIDQIGMFCFTGLKPEEVDILREKYHIYMTRNGRISVAGVNTNNVDYLASAIHDVTK